MAQKAITTLDDIKILVDRFYEKVKIDSLLGPIFNGILKDDWSQHLEKLYRFWQTILLEEHTYHGSPFAPHAQLPVRKEHFERWMHLFNQTIDEHFIGEKAADAKWRAEKMAELFLHKIEFYRNNSVQSVL